MVPRVDILLKSFDKIEFADQDTGYISRHNFIYYSIIL